MTGRVLERWLSWWRLALVVVAALQVGVFARHYPGGYESAAWATTAVFAAGALVIAGLIVVVDDRRLAALGLASLVFDGVIASAFVLVFSYEYSSPARWALVAVVIEAGLRYALLGGIVAPLALIPFYAYSEHFRVSRFGPPGYVTNRVTIPAGTALLIGLTVGWLVSRLRAETAATAARASESEELRDELGRRGDAIDAANRCARALGSSLVLEDAFAAFIRELRGLVPFDRASIVLAEDGNVRMMAVSGLGAGEVLPPGTSHPIAGTLLDEVLRTTQTQYRPEMVAGQFAEEDRLLELGLSARLLAPLLSGARPIGGLALLRREAASFSPQEVELTGLLGRLVATAVQNIRAYDAERNTVEELRRLSKLRADFVALVSHELRSPIAAVSGAAQTLRHRWEQLSRHEREVFFVLMEDESARLVQLASEVLDTSMIDAGTFSYSFGEVDVGALVRAAAQAAGSSVEVAIEAPLPSIRGDAERLRQVVSNLVDNALKYSPDGAPVEVRVYAEPGRLLVDVSDRGPGVDAADRARIFEKFGRAPGENAKPGTGLGLFISRSIAEAHGGSLDVESSLDRGSTFTLSLPA